MAYPPAELERLARQVADRPPASPPTQGLVLIGVDHRTAALELRERLSLAEEAQVALLRGLAEKAAIAELAMVSTCNRTELYMRAQDPGAAFRCAFETAFLSRAPEVGDEGRFYVKHDIEAARHLMHVACGLESMVLGEPEILGQVKQAAARAKEHGLVTSVLETLFRHAIAAGGRARRETEIGAGAVSFGYAVVELARSIFSRLERTEVLIIGAGETGRLIAQSLAERGVRRLRVANRGHERAEQLHAALPQVEIVPFDQRDRWLGESDVVVASTGAPEPLVLESAVTAAMEKRRGRALLAVDLGVPRNIESAVGAIDNVFLQDIDALKALIDRNLKRRRGEVAPVVEIVESELGRFTEWAARTAAEPLIAALHRQAEEVHRRELARLRGRLDDATFAEVERVTGTVVRKLLHHPRRFLRGAAGDPAPHTDVVRRLFGLDDES